MVVAAVEEDVMEAVVVEDVEAAVAEVEDGETTRRRSKIKCAFVTRSFFK